MLGKMRFKNGATAADMVELSRMDEREDFQFWDELLRLAAMLIMLIGKVTKEQNIEIRIAQ